MLDNAGCCGLLLLCLPRQCFDGRAAFADHPHTVGSAFEIACDFVGSPACKFVRVAVGGAVDIGNPAYRSGREAHHHQQPSATRPPCGIDIVVIVKKPADNQGIRSAVRAATPFDPVVIAIEGTIRVACRRFFFWPVS
jgi:hypothetical protein